MKRRRFGVSLDALTNHTADSFGDYFIMDPDETTTLDYVTQVTVNYTGSYGNVTSIPDNHSNTSPSEQLLFDFNAEIFHRRLPNTILISVMMNLGVIGNFIVLYVYFTRLNRKNVERYFVPFLAVVDFAACVIGPTFSLLENVYAVIFPSNLLCKTMWYTTSLSSGLSISVLSIIAINRYLKLCRPHGRQLTVYHKRMFMAAMFTIVTLILIPMVFFVELQYIDLVYKNEHVIGITCAPHNPRQTLGETIYFGCMFGVISIIIIITAGLYTAVGKVVFERLRKTRKGSVPSSIQPSPRFVRNNKVGNDRKDSVASVLSATNNVLQETRSQLDIRKKSSVNGVLNEDSSILDTRKESAMNGQALHLPRSTNGAYRQYRMNFYIMFLTIFVCNTISFVPSMIYLFLHEHDLYFFFRHDDAVLNIHLTMQRLYVTNHVLNPFIYGYFDITFRKHVIDTFRRVPPSPTAVRQVSSGT